VTPMTKRLAIMLAVSVGINLMLGGVLLGSRLQRWTHRHAGPAASFAPGPRHDVRRDGHDGRGALRHRIRDQHPELKERREKTFAARNAVRAALEKEPFDKAELERSLETLRQETGRGQEAAHRALVQSAESAGAAERRELASEFTFQRRGGRRKP
jgi:uncharacterized membrane protein